jgi:dTDP-4-dehydrorhamnose reductase
MIWIVGNRGMLGRELQLALEAAGHEVLGTGREVDLASGAALEACFSARVRAGGGRLDWIINCAAYTAVDQAEEEPELCRRLNVDGPAQLAAFAAAKGAALLYVSSDYVFDGKGIPGAGGQPRAYREDDPVGPSGVYGRTKVSGEAAVRAACPRHVIIRTAWLFGLCGPNFVLTMLALMRARDAIGVVADQWGSPTRTRDLAAAIGTVVENPRPSWGTFHCSGAGLANWHDFAVEIFRHGRARGLLDHEVAIAALRSGQYPARARRPVWSLLDCSKISESYGVKMPAWRASLTAFFALVPGNGSLISSCTAAGIADMPPIQPRLETEP